MGQRGRRMWFGVFGILGIIEGAKSENLKEVSFEVCELRTYKSRLELDIPVHRFNYFISIVLLALIWQGPSFLVEGETPYWTRLG